LADEDKTIDTSREEFLKERYWIRDTKLRSQEALDKILLPISSIGIALSSTAAEYISTLKLPSWPVWLAVSFFTLSIVLLVVSHLVGAKGAEVQIANLDSAYKSRNSGPLPENCHSKATEVLNVLMCVAFSLGIAFYAVFGIWLVSLS